MLHPCGNVLRLLTLVASMLVAAWPACAQRQRLLPPEPSRQPWISAEAVRAQQSAVTLYQNIVARGGFPRLPDRITLRPGDSDANVAVLRRRLELSGDLRGSAIDSYTFDPELEQAVKRYQLRNGLEPNGIVYGITQRSLNVPAETRLKQLELNLARMQELQPKLATYPRYILMNAASFELQGIQGGRVEVISRTIAGKRSTPTPTVGATVQSINIMPYWHVPETIAKAALIPAVRKDPDYLTKEHIRVYSTFGGEEVDPSSVNWWGLEAERYVFRQDPGPHNALGLLRFDMPNKHIVYMHDTPMKNLFSYYERAYSAGCVRLESFVDVAGWILAGQEGWNRASVASAIASGTPRTIKVQKPVPVHFVYFTAWVDGGAVQFRNDLYNRDDQEFDGGQDAAQRAFGISLAP